jgi:rhodanese-related sulfurtransferase
MQTNQLPAISVRDAATAAANGELVLLDVREIDEWMAGHAPDAVHIAMSSVVDRVGELDRTRRIACVCRSGNRSGRVTGWLISQGYDAVNVTGGMQSWSALGQPVVNHYGDPGIVI